MPAENNIERTQIRLLALTHQIEQNHPESPEPEQRNSSLPPGWRLISDDRICFITDTDTANSESSSDGEADNCNSSNSYIDSTESIFSPETNRLMGSDMMDFTDSSSSIDD